MMLPRCSTRFPTWRAGHDPSPRLLAFGRSGSCDVTSSSGPSRSTTSTASNFADAYLVASAERTGVGAIVSFDRSIDRVRTVRRIEPAA